MSEQHITFIGGGNMATALVSGLIADNTPAQDLTVADPNAERRSYLSAQFGVHTTEDNRDAVTKAQVVVLAVKPQIAAEVVKGIAAELRSAEALLISVAAGIRCRDLERWLSSAGQDKPPAIVRSMPNTPAMLQAGATALYANAATNTGQREFAERLLRSVGLTRWVDDESAMDAATALSGSGPAYFFLVMEAMEAAGQELGLDAETAHLLTLQTALGAARMAIESPDDPATLRHKVTSPGGTTERALERLEKADLRAIFAEALTAARDRSVAISAELGDE
jgi:pyrroline-5-carboxylate reductase